MTEKKTTLQEHAMKYGTLMGIFWACKFALFPTGMHNLLFLMAFFLLTLIVPVAGFFFVRQFRDRECGGILPFTRAFLFIILMYLFASLFVSIVHYGYFRFLDNGLIVDTYQGMLNQLSAAATSDMKTSLEQFQQALDLISSLSPLDITLQIMTQNFLYCTFIAIPTALVVMRNPQKE